MWKPALSLLVLMVITVPPVHAQWAVEDVYVGSQTFITASNSVRALIQQSVQIANEATIIKQQLEQLSYDAANLTQSPLQLLDQIYGAVGQYEQLLTRASGLGFQTQALQGKVASLYPSLGQPVTSEADAAARVQAWLQEVRGAGVTALESQAIAPRLQAQRNQVQLGLSASQSAPGALGVSQVTNQLLGVLAGQLASLQETAAASERVRTTETLAQTQAADQAAQAAQAHVAGMGTVVEMPKTTIPDFR